MATDPELLKHKEWLGLLQPEGLVVSPPALAHAQAFVDRTKAIALQPILQSLLSAEPLANGLAWVPDFPVFAEQVLEWEPEDYSDQVPETLEVVLPDYGETLQASYVVDDPDNDNPLLLIQVIPAGHDMDGDDQRREGLGWKATYQQKFERLLKGANVPIGVLWNGCQVRLVYAPQGESSGHLTFPIQAMTEVPGRLILGALEMLLGGDRLFNAPSDRTLPKLLEQSRNYQAEVSTKLAGQVLDALWELLRGFQLADTERGGRLLTPHPLTPSPQGEGEPASDLPSPNLGEGPGVRASDPFLGEGSGVRGQHIYGGLITTLMRLVFLLYAEDEGLMPDEEVYQRHYAVSGLYEKLREDDGSYHDTMDQRYGAWAALLSLFRLVYDGGGAYAEYLPARHGQLFDPDEYPFLEGRPQGSHYQTFGRVDAPRIADGVVYRILDKLLMLEGDRLSYRALDVEQIGSVYEAIMGYEVEVAEGRSLALKPKDVVMNLDRLLVTPAKDRAKVLQDEAECKVTGKGLTTLKQAKTVEEIGAALDRRISSRTPNLLPKGSLYLQPGEERRRTGSHYTPRKLTQPIVATTLRPVLEALGERPTPDQILALKVCDLAMGSAAFLVEACRQLAERLVMAWDTHGLPADLPDAVEPLLYARRLVAQRCLYGVDKNPFAVNLAKLSLWLVTLAKDQPFTFVDHALKCGDSLVGLTRSQIGSFGKDPTEDLPLFKYLKEKVDRAKSYRAQIQALDTRTDQDAEAKLAQLHQAEQELEEAKLIGDVKIAAFFDGKSKKDRDAKLSEYGEIVRRWRTSYTSPPSPLSMYGEGGQERGGQDASGSPSPRVEKGVGDEVKAIRNSLRNAEKPITPFNWEIEFPEVFDRENPGFDAIVGNPPFAGKNTTINSNPEGYVDWLKVVHPEAHGNADLVAHFFRRAFTIIRHGGAFGLIATNTIAQGDTRSTGLRYICNHGGIIYNATRRYRWPGVAAVVVSLVHIWKGTHKEQAS